MSTDAPLQAASERWLGSVHLRRPTAEDVERRVERMSTAELTYDGVGQTRGTMPAGWNHDATEGQIGSGRATFDAAADALRRWTQFDLRWVEAHDRTVPLKPGATFAFVSRQLAVWSLNICRIVYVVDEPNSFGFAYGTVGDHVLRGEELFLVVHDPETDAVHFRIRKFSLPAHLLVRLAGPVTQHLQKRFSEDAIHRMQREVTHAI